MIVSSGIRGSVAITMIAPVVGPLRAVRTHDPDEAAMLISQLHPGCDRIMPAGRGPFRYAAGAARLGTVGVSRQSSSAFSSGLVSVPRGIRVLLAHEGRVTARAGSAERSITRRDGLVMIAPEASGAFSEDYRGMALAVPTERIRTLLAAMHCDVDPLRFAAANWHQAGLPGSALLGRALVQAFAQLDEDPALLAMPEAAAAMGELLACQMARLIARSTNPHVADAPPRALRRCLDYLDAHAGSRIDLAQMAHEAGISLRSAQSLFARHLGMTITAHVRNLRLDRVRQRLERAQGASCISRIALEEGFTHLGEFGRQYRARFHMAPSDTVREAAH